ADRRPVHRRRGVRQRRVRRRRVLRRPVRGRMRGMQRSGGRAPRRRVQQHVLGRRRAARRGPRRGGSPGRWHRAASARCRVLVHRRAIAQAARFARARGVARARTPPWIAAFSGRRARVGETLTNVAPGLATLQSGGAHEGDGMSTPARSNSDITVKALDVIVVEDDHDARTLMASLLQAQEFLVRAFEEAEAAHESALARVPDVVVTDLRLRDGSAGWTLARALRENARTAHVSLIAVTGNVAPEREVVAAFDAYLRKPIDAA